MAEPLFESCIPRDNFGLESRVALPVNSKSEPREVDSRIFVPQESPLTTNNCVDREDLRQVTDPAREWTKYIDLLEIRIRRLEGRSSGLPNGSFGERKEANRQASSILEPMQRPAIPEIHRIPWFQFKNKYVDETKTYAIELLVGPPRYYYQRRRNVGAQRQELLLKQAKTPRFDNVIAHTPGQQNGRLAYELPDRIRINSWPILLILSKIASEDWALKPRIFLRPYKLFTYYRRQIREEFKHLESKYTEDDLENNDGNGSLQFDRNSIQCTCAVCTKSLASLPLTESLEAHRDMRCLIEFMDEYIHPTLEKYIDTPAKVSFADLWWTIDSGEDVYAQGSSPSTSVRNHGDFQSVWRVLSCSGGRPNLSPRSERLEELSATADTNPFVVTCYYIDFTGSAYTESVSSFSIYPFEGQKDITSLPICPLRYYRNGDTMRDDRIKRGKMFQEFHTCKHMYYKGFTLNRQPTGNLLDDEHAAKSPEYVDSKVIVDFHTTLENNPGWTPKYKGPSHPPSFPRQFEEDFAL